MVSCYNYDYCEGVEIMKIKLITDSTCDLSKTLIEEHDIDVIPLFVNFSETSYKDGVELTTEEMYEKVSELGMVPKTAAASPGMFEETFKKYIENDYEIIYLGIGAKFSATYQNAMLAKKLLDDSDKIHIVDSRNLSSGSGLLLLKAAKYKAQGKSPLEIVELLNKDRLNVKTAFVIDTLEYLHKGGRLKAISAFVGTMLKLHPIIKVVDGEMTIGKKPRGKMSNAIKHMLKDVLKDSKHIDPDFLMVTHSKADQYVDMIKEELEDIDIENIYETEAGCVISSHCGAGTIGVLYIKNND